MKNKFFILTALILSGVGLSYIYCYICIYHIEDKLKIIKQTLYIKENSINLSFNLPKDAFILNLKHIINNEQKREIFFNNLKVSANIWPYERKNKDIGITYIYLPKEIVRQGKNTINITFSNNTPNELRIKLTNYRKKISEQIYILFSDSAHLPTGTSFFRFHPFYNVVILTLAIIIYFLGSNISGQRYPLFLLFVLLLLFLTGWIYSSLGYRVIVTPIFFFELTFVILAPFFIIKAHDAKNHPVYFSKTINFWFTEQNFRIGLGAIISILIIITNIWVYWPSLFHIFRHDEWFLFYSSKDITPNLQFIIKHIDWQLKLPYDRLNFRPILTTTLAINRVLFDTNYIGPHILTFIKHMVATFTLWFVLWRTHRSWISALFVLLFSLLITGIDPIMWPHVDAYITTTIFILSMMFLFSLVIDRNISSNLALCSLSILIFLGILTTQLALVTPFVFFMTYWLTPRKTNIDGSDTAYKPILLSLFAPLFIWAICYIIHLYFAYPFNMTSQSEMVNLWKVPINVGRFIFLTLIGILMPIAAFPSFADKVYVKISFGTFLTIITLFIVILLRRKGYLILRNKKVLPAFLMVISMVALICLTRASYIDNLLSISHLPSYYTYCINAILIFSLYKFLDFNRIRQRALILIALLYLIVAHGLKTNFAAEEIEKQTQPLKKYFCAVSQFVSHHKIEPDFSFKIIDRPPKTKIFNWYHETCIDGLFHRCINNKTPKYILEYNYVSENLMYSLYNKNPEPIASSTRSSHITKDADYINSIDMHFKNILGQNDNFLIGMFEVTQKQWKKVMGFNPSKFEDDNRPVENVSYYMVQKFIEQLNKMEAVNAYRLPSEQEYEYLTDFHAISIYEDEKSADIYKYAWSKGNAEGMTHPVGQIQPMPVGLYDLVGNVWEWTQNTIEYNSVIKPLKDNPRICFGGSWRDDIINSHNLKTNYPPDFRHENLGFRLVKEYKKSK